MFTVDKILAVFRFIVYLLKRAEGIAVKNIDSATAAINTATADLEAAKAEAAKASATQAKIKDLIS